MFDNICSVDLEYNGIVATYLDGSLFEEHMSAIIHFEQNYVRYSFWDNNKRVTTVEEKLY